MTALVYLIKRNLKIYFKDRGMFVASMITPVILLVLYALFLARIFKDGFVSALPDGVTLPDKVLGGAVGAQLVSSLLAVCSITVSFCANLVMVNDRVTGAVDDLLMTSTDRTIITLGYYFATVLSALVICALALAASLIYLAVVGFYLSALDVLLIVLDVVILVNFGAALSTLIFFPMKTEGQSSAVATIVSAGYGFICGAYMPIASFPKAIANAVTFLPGTYGTVILRNHAFRGVLKEMTSLGVPDAVIDGLRDTVDCNIYFFGKQIPLYASFIALAGAVVLLLVAVAVVAVVSGKKRGKKG